MNPNMPPKDAPAILFLVSKLGSGGVQIALENTLRQLSGRFSCEVVSIYQSDDFYTQRLPKGVKYSSLDVLRNNIPIVRSIYSRLFDKGCIQSLALRMLMKRSRADLLVSYSDGITIQAGSKVRGIPKIAWIHTDLFDERNRNVPDAGHIGKIFSQYDATIFVSQAIRDSFVEKTGYESETAVIPNPVDVESLIERSLEPVPEAKNPEKLLILAVGRLSYEKGFDMLIKSFHLLPEDLRVKCELRIIGEGEEKAKLEQLISELNLGSSVSLLGFRSNPFPYLKMADLVVVPSYFEGYGLSAAEALALSKPVLSTATLGCTEILDHGRYGTLCAIDDKSLSEKLAYCIEHIDALKEKALAGPVRAAELSSFNIAEYLTSHLS